MLLGLTQRGRVPNAFAEVLTGQGKSWVLLLLGTILAVTGHDVKVLCHNHELTARDNKAAAEFLALIKKGVRNMATVHYTTFTDMTWAFTRSTTSEGRRYGLDELMVSVLNKKK